MRPALPDPIGCPPSPPPTSVWFIGDTLLASLFAQAERIHVLDLSQVKRKIMEPEPEGKGWSQEQADQAEVWYKRFLELCLYYPKAPVVPNYPIDMMWHQHILDTRAYARDCQAIFGRFVHHYPYFGLNGDAEVRDTSFDDTNAAYLRHFGEDCKNMGAFRKPRVPEDCMIKGANCAGDCKGGGCNVAVKASACGGGTSCGTSTDGGKDPSCKSDYHPNEHTLANNREAVGANCGGGGSGTGCGQSNCGGSHDPTAFGRPSNLIGATMGSNCNHDGSGTGCGQGCGRK